MLGARLAHAHAGGPGHARAARAADRRRTDPPGQQAPTRRLAAAHFKATCAVEDYDFAFNQQVPAGTIRDPTGLEFLAAGQSIILHGPDSCHLVVDRRGQRPRPRPLLAVKARRPQRRHHHRPRVRLGAEVRGRGLVFQSVPVLGHRCDKPLCQRTRTAPGWLSAQLGRACLVSTTPDAPLAFAGTGTDCARRLTVTNDLDVVRWVAPRARDQEGNWEPVADGVAEAQSVLE